MYTGHKFVCWVVIFVFFHTPSLVANPDILLKKRANLMGSVFEISLVGTDSASLEYQIQLVIDEIERIENLISEWRPYTQISEVNRNAGIRPVKVDREVFELTRRAISYSILSDGAFDISVAALDKIWRFDGNMDALPSDTAVQNSVTKVGFEKIELDSIASTIFLKQSGMKIGFGSIGKAYAADRGRHILQEMGVKGGLINASGDIALWGKPPEKKSWSIGISDPEKPYKITRKLRMKEGAVATSGNYQKYVMFNGVRYSHIMDPRTGYPATELASVTVIGPMAEFANALSTSVMVLGVKKGLKLMERYPQYRFVMITAKGRTLRS